MGLYVVHICIYVCTIYEMKKKIIIKRTTAAYVCDLCWKTLTKLEYPRFVVLLLYSRAQSVMCEKWQKAHDIF